MTLSHFTNIKGKGLTAKAKDSPTTGIAGGVLVLKHKPKKAGIPKDAGHVHLYYLSFKMLLQYFSNAGMSDMMVSQSVSVSMVP